MGIHGELQIRGLGIFRQFGSFLQAGKFRPDDRWGMRIGPSRRAGEEQEVHPELRRCVHTFYSSLQEARGVCCVLGSGKLSAPEWSQSRNTVDISQAAEVQSGVKLPRILAGAATYPSASSPK